MLLNFALPFFFVLRACAELFQSPADLPSNVTYDYIVVGGGAAGGVLANRLTEDIRVKVLVIEAGSSNFNDLNIEVPWFAPSLAGSVFDWNFTTEANPGLNNRSLAYARGFVLGGSTDINFMAYTRGSRDDYDRWAAVTGDEGWSWDSLFPYMLKMENMTAPADHRNTSTEVIATLHGHHGLVGTSVPGITLPTDQRILGASAEDPSEFPFNPDVNSGDTVGISWAQSTIANGQRVNSATAYFTPALSRPNLHILVNTQVTKIVRTGEYQSVLIFRGVEFAQNVSSPVYFLNASKEVILSSGAVKTPQLLMLSGIGDTSVLSSVGVETIVDLPDVGQNLQDHPMLASQFTVNANDTSDNLSQNATFLAQELYLWETNRMGELVLSPTNLWGWLRLPPDSPVFDNFTDPSAGMTSSRYEFILTDGFVSFLEAPPSDGHFFTAFTNVVSPSARGYIIINSTNPFNHPVIHSNLLGTELDLLTMREAVKSARRFMNASAWDGWILDEFGPFKAARTDEEIDEYARSNGVTVDHVSCTVSMGRTGSPRERGQGALNSDLTVKGTLGLRVVDASIFPFIPAAHTQTPTYVVAERAADIIKASWNTALSY